MSFLTPLFLAVGVAAVAVPVLLHLLRPTPRTPRFFPAVRFLDHAPAWTVRRRNLEDWPLFLLRGLLLCLLGAAFARPILERLSPEETPRHVVVLLDVSAGMRRGDLFERALRAASDRIAATGPNDRVSLATFDDQVHWIVRGDDDAHPAGSQRTLVLENLAALRPGWRGTDLTATIDHVADELRAAKSSKSPVRRDSITRKSDDTAADSEIVVVSDFARGGRAEGLSERLETSPFPIRLIPIDAPPATNAGLQWLRSDVGSAPTDGDAVRVRVTNAADSTGRDFQIVWRFAKDSLEPPSDMGQSSSYAPSFEVIAMPLVVPPGERRIVTSPKAPAGARLVRVELTGDDHDFDNALDVAPSHAAVATIAYLGDESPDDADGMRYYFDRAFPRTSSLDVEIVSGDAARRLLSDEPSRVALAVATDAVDPETERALAAMIAQGGQLLIAARTDEASRLFERIAAPVGWDKPAAGLSHPTHATVGVTLAEIDFDHPLFAPFAGPQFGDFSKIRFWTHRRANVSPRDGIRILARFDDGDAALVEARRGDGRAFLLAAGWHPDDSQLARSSRFAPLLNQLLRLSPRCRTVETNALAGDAIPVRALAADTPDALAIATPDGRTLTLDPARVDFTDTEVPGRYSIENRAAEFCIHVPPTETETSPLPRDLLAHSASRSRGDLRANDATAAAIESTPRRGAQTWWRMLILAALAVIALETAIANRRRESTERRPSVEALEARSISATRRILT